MRGDNLYLQDVLDAIGKIEAHSGRGRADFDADQFLQVWMVHHIQIIGEAVQRVSQPLRAKHPEVPWAEIAAMRNILVHGYFQIDLDEVWSVVEKDVPVLKPKIEAILDELGGSPKTTN